MEKKIEPRTYEWVKENMRKANERYRNSNRERFNQKQKEYYDYSRKEDEEYKQKMRKKALDYYYRKEAEKAEQARRIEAEGSIL